MRNSPYIGHFIIDVPISHVQKIYFNPLSAKYIAKDPQICAKIFAKKHMFSSGIIFLLQKIISIIALETAESEVQRAKPKYFKKGTKVTKNSAFSITDIPPKITGDFVSPQAKYTEEKTFVRT